VGVTFQETPVKIISGGQTGADRAGLDAAIDSEIEHGGWVPKGMRAEDGSLPPWYDLEEMPTRGYPARTEKNVLESDGTVVFTLGEMTNGCALTIRLCGDHDKPFLHIPLHLDWYQKNNKCAGHILYWMGQHDISVLNVAGSRESKAPGIYDRVYAIIKEVVDVFTEGEG
jgi:hypothetical protein